MTTPAAPVSAPPPAPPAPVAAPVTPPAPVAPPAQRPSAAFVKNERKKQAQREEYQKQDAVRQAQMKEIAEFKGLQAKAKSDPLAFVKLTTGLDYDALTNINLNGGKLPADVVATQTQVELQALRKQIDDRFAEQQQQEVQRLQGAQKQAVEAMQHSLATASRDATRYPFLALTGASERPWLELTRHYEETAAKDPARVGEALSAEEACAKAEAAIRANLKELFGKGKDNAELKALALEHFAPAPPVEEAKAAPIKDTKTPTRTPVVPAGKPEPKAAERKKTSDDVWQEKMAERRQGAQ